MNNNLRDDVMRLLSGPEAEMGLYLREQGLAEQAVQPPSPGMDNPDPSQRNLSWAETIGTAAANTYPSMKKFGSEMWDMATSPVETAKGLGSAVAGYAQLAGTALGTDLLGDSYIANAEAINEYIMSRYGGIEAFKRALAADPVGVAADFAAVATGGGAAVRTLAKGANIASKAAPVAAAAGAANKVGTTLGNIGRAVDPVTQTARAMGGAADALGVTNFAEKIGQAAREQLHAGAKNWYLRMLQPEIGVSAAEKTALAETGLKGKYVFNNAATEKLNAGVAALEKDVQKALNARTALEEAGTVPRVVDPLDIAIRVEADMKNPSHGGTYDRIARESADAVVSDFLERADRFSSPMTIRAAHQLQNELRTVHQKNLSKMSVAEREASNAIQQRLRTAIGNALPEDAPKIAELERLRNFQDVHASAAKRIQENGTIGVMPFLMAAGAGLTGTNGMDMAGRAIAALAGTSAAKAPNLEARMALRLDSLDGSSLRKAALPAMRGVGINRRAEEQNRLSLLDLF